MAASPTRTQRTGRSGHTHYLDGQKVPGVTTIMSKGIPKPGLIRWGSSTVADYVVNRLTVDGDHVYADELVDDALAWNATRPRPAKVGNDRLPRLGLADILTNIRFRDLDEASNRGTEVHAFAAKLVAGDEVVVPPELVGHVQAYADFLDAWQPTNVWAEFSVINRTRRYMGVGDLIADFDGVWADGPRAGEPIGTGLLDIKTSRSGVFAETALQLAGYRFAEKAMIDGAEVDMRPVDWCGVIWVRADGYDVHPVTADEAAFKTLLYAQAVGDWLDWDTGPAGTAVAAAVPPPHHTTTT